MKYIKYILSIAISVLVVSAVVYAGSLTPPGSVTNTMYTLEDIYNKLNANTNATLGSGTIPSTPGSASATFYTLTDVYNAIPVPGKLLKTFGTNDFCYDDAGTLISCAGTGQDGQYQSGLFRSYTDNGDLTITDNNTGLMWMKCTVGLSGASCGTGSPTGMSFNTATSSCIGLSLAGHSDWRVPNLTELMSLVDQGNNPAINNTFFPQTVPSYYLTSTVYKTTPTYSYRVSFLTGEVTIAPRSNNAGYVVRCVRGGL